MIARMIGLHNKYFTIPNLVIDEELIPEFIQEDVKASSLAQAAWDLLEDPQRCDEIRRRFATLREELALGADDRAADAVIELAT
jgi:lipid-A-disaccharide synthase